MRISDITIPNSAILLEANVLNVKDLYADVSVIAYATKYAKHIEDKALAKGFVIKFGKLMVNDERWHKAVRQLPDDAPDWAKTAFTNRDLVFFHPNQQLDQQLEHITHYLEAVGADAKGTDPDLKIRAEREKSAFLKVANFDEMVKRSNDWFVGSNKSKVSVDGMTEIAKTGQFTWYILQDQAAFKREGKMMQNCLGSHWTLASATNSAQSIVIMRKSNGESVVAARILNKTNEIIEMKGKQNKAPVDEYMGGVLSFIRQRKLIVGKNATNDFERAGYFSIEDKLYTRAEAIEKFLHKEKIGVVGDRQLIRISFKAEMAHLMKEAYPAFKNALYSYESAKKHGSELPDINIYELRDGSGHADIAALVVDKEIMNVNRSERQADTPAINENITTQSSETLTLIEELFKRKLADRVNNKVNQNVFWNDSMAFDAAGKLQKTKHANIKHSKKGHDWKHHTEAGEIHAAHTEFKDDPEETWNNDDSALSTVERSNIHSYYLTKHKKRDEKRLDRGHIAAMRTYHGHSVTKGDDKDASVSKDLKARGKLFPHRLADSVYGIRTNSEVSIHKKPMLAASRHSTSKPGMKDHKTIDSLMDLANEENLDLPGAFKVNSGIQTDKEGKHSKYVPTPTTLDADGKEKKYNLSNITNNLEKVVAFEKIATSLDVRPWTGETFDNVPNPDHRANDVNSTKGVKAPGAYRSTRYDAHLEDDSRDIDVEKMKQHYHGKDFPDDIYTLSTEYGADKKHDIMMLVKNDEIYQIDGSTTRHPFQHWGDHEEIAKQINKFAADHGLKIKRRFLNRMNSEELRNGKEGITTASELVKTRLAKMEAEGTTGREGTDSLPMANGSKVVKLGAEEQADYLRKELDLNSVPGQGWKVVDDDGNVKGTFFVKRDKIMSIYSGHDKIRDPDTADNQYTFIDKPASPDLPKNKGFGQKMMPELKGAMQAFGWEISPKLHFKVDTHLRTQSRRLSKMADGRNHNTTAGTAQNELSQKLKDRGFVDSVQMGRYGARNTGRRNVWKINQRGRNYLRDLKSQSSKVHWGKDEQNNPNNPPTAHFTHGDRAGAVQFDYVVPEKKAKPEKKKKQRTASTTDTTSTATPRSGSKAGQALDLFRQHVTDHDEMPSRRDFINILQDEPFNMGKAGASTYYANTKKKYSALNEKYSVLAALELMVENKIFLEDWI